MLNRNYLPSYFLRVFDALLLIACGLLAKIIYEEYKGVDLDTQRYSALILFGCLTFLFVNNRLYRSWRSEGFFKLWQTVLIIIAKTWLIIILWLIFSKTNILYSRLWLILWALLTGFNLIL